MPKVKPDPKVIDAEISQKYKEIEKLMKDLEKLAAKSDTPTIYPVSDYVGYIPKVWAKRYAALADKEANDTHMTPTMTEEEESELEAMRDEIPTHAYEWGLESGPIWAPSTC